MEERRYTIAALECLSTKELTALADEEGIAVPPELDRIFIIEELLELENDDLEEASDWPPENTVPEHIHALRSESKHTEPAQLPKQYNITYIDLLVRDPVWVFVFWEIKSQTRETLEASGDFGGYMLKVVPLDGADIDTRTFTVPVGNNDSKWYLGFPPGGGNFRMECCVNFDGEEHALAVSRPFSMPRLYDPRQWEDASGISVLSGIKDYPILQSQDRHSKIPRHGEHR
ncbi:hypothetical protein FACS1894151_03120 [Spirochaetia bacterium]|nr:hypothetical protein FACS1894151_03120 [Spirochaetia bacterium]